MSYSHKVVWSEGMFLKPQHFQQQDRYIERYVESRCNASGAYQWGVQELSLDNQLLDMGKISLLRARGIFPDGTPFNMPDENQLADVLSVPAGLHDVLVYLALPLRRPGSLEIASGSDISMARYHSQESQVRDATSQSGDLTELDLAHLRVQLILGDEDLSGFACIPVARIKESREDQQVVLDPDFIAPWLNCRNSTQLSGYLGEVVGMLKQRGEALAGRLADSGRAGSAEIADYLLLQLVNRQEPWLKHLAQLQGLHPKDLYGELVQIVGEFSTFTSATKRPPEFSPYIHDQLQQCFAPLSGAMRQSLSMVMEQSAVSLELVERKFGIYVSPINDRSLISGSMFYLAIKADIQSEKLRTLFPAQVKVGPVEKIRQLVNAAMPGMTLKPVPVAPRQIPYHAGMTYFELDTASDFWRDMQSSGGFAVHVGAEFPGLEMEFWAIRN